MGSGEAHRLSLLLSFICFSSSVIDVLPPEYEQWFLSFRMSFQSSRVALNGSAVPSSRAFGGPFGVTTNCLSQPKQTPHFTTLCHRPRYLSLENFFVKQSLLFTEPDESPLGNTSSTSYNALPEQIYSRALRKPTDPEIRLRTVSKKGGYLVATPSI